MHRFVSATALSSLFVLASVAAAHGGEGPKSSEDPTRPLEVLVGSWDVAVRYKLPDGKAYQGKAVCVIRRVLNGRFIEQDYTSRMNNQPLLVRQILGYDAFKKRFVETQLHVQGKDAHTLHTEGTLTDDGKVLTLRGESVDGFTGRPAKLRTVTTVRDHDYYMLEWFVTDKSGKEGRQVVLTHTRKK